MNYRNPTYNARARLKYLIQLVQSLLIYDVPPSTRLLFEALHLSCDFVFTIYFYVRRGVQQWGAIAAQPEWLGSFLVARVS